MTTMQNTMLGLLALVLHLFPGASLLARGIRAPAVLILVAIFCAAPARGQNGAGTALSFDGVNGFASIANSPSLNVYPLTVMGWFRSFDQGLDRGMVNKYVVNSFNGYNVYFHQGRVRAWYFRDANNFVWDSGRGLDSGFVAGVWVHFAFTVDATGGKLYINGVLRDSRPWTGTPGPATQAQDVQFGRYANNFLNGQLDEVSIWNVALSPSAIAGARNRRLAPNEAGLLAYWRFEEGTGVVAADAVPGAAGNNAATLQGGVAWVPTGPTLSPHVITRGISGQTLQGGVNLSGSVNPLGLPTTAFFEWGTNTSYGNRTTAANVGSGSNFVTAGALLSGLQQGRTYHYRYVATNVNGRANGDDQSFTQPVYPAPGGAPPLRSSFYDPVFGNWVEFEPRAGWDSAVPMTIEAWVYRTDATRYETILSHDWPGSYWLGFAPRLRFYRGTNFAEVPTPVPAQKWTHVAVSYDGAIARFYINGEYEGARPMSNTGAGKLRMLRVGHNGTDPNDFSPINMFAGNLDEIRLWSVARSGEEIIEGLYQEVHGAPGLAAVFPRGGRIEEVTGLVGSGGPPTEQIFGMVPRDLVVPRAAFAPFADGRVDYTTEYLGAEQLVLRYPNDPLTRDAIAYFVHTTNDLFVGVRGVRNVDVDWSFTNSWVGLFIDPAYARPVLAGLTQALVEAYHDFNRPARYLNGDDGGGYFRCTTFNPLSGFQPCTPNNLWQTGLFQCDGELSPFCTEFRVSRTILGSFNEFDGVAVGHFDYTPFGDQAFEPQEGFSDSPATWLTMSYGEGSANVPRVRWSGRVFAGLDTNNTSRPLAGYRVSLIAGSAGQSQLTGASGEFSFDVPLPTGQMIFAQAELEAFGRYTLPSVRGAGVAPQFVLTNRVIFPALAPNASGIIPLKSVDFFVQRPLPASAITSATPASPQCGMVVRQGEPGGPGELVTLRGTNLHAEMEFFLAPVSATFPTTPSAWNLIPVAVENRDPNGTWVQVRAPFLPEFVAESVNQVFIPTFTSQWRWVAHDSWFRAGRIEYSHVGTFTLRRPPYPNVHGFNFVNDQTFPDLYEFLATYGYSAYYCVDPIGDCGAHVPDPLYWLIWYPIHALIIDSTGGSCVGFSGSSLQLFQRVLNPINFDPLAFTAMGMVSPGYAAYWDESNTGGVSTRPPIPKNIWARIRMDHGTQTSVEYLHRFLSQLDLGILSDSSGGNPVARLNEIRANPTGFALCVSPSIGEGHCVVPYRVEDNPTGTDPDISRIWIYDNEAPCSPTNSATDSCVTSQFIDVSHTTNVFQYGGWRGNLMFTVPVSLYREDHHAPGPEDIPFLFITLAGDADARYISGNREWGWRADGTLVTNFPGLLHVPPIGSRYNSTRNVPVLLSVSNNPALSNLAVQVNLRGSNAHIFHAAAGNTLLQLEASKGTAGHSNRITLGIHSNQLTSFRFIPQTAHSNFTPRIGFAISNRASAAFQWMGLAGEGGRAQEFRALKNRRAVEYRNETARPTSHYLRVDAVDGGTRNNTCAVFGPFNVPTGAVHCVVLHDWPRVKQVRSELDLNADGTPDQVTIVTGTSIDSDRDGMPDDWETLHQLNPASALCDDGPDFDPDRDGVSNLGEYLTDTDPHDAASALRLTATMLPGNKVRLSWKAVPGRRYEIYYANGLEYVFQPLAGAGLPRMATATAEHFDDTLPAGGTRTRFYQLRLVP